VRSMLRIRNAFCSTVQSLCSCDEKEDERPSFRCRKVRNADGVFKFLLGAICGDSPAFIRHGSSYGDFLVSFWSHQRRNAIPSSLKICVMKSLTNQSYWAGKSD